MVNQTLISKIEKLLEMGRRGGTEHESQIAMKKVHSLLAAHNLSMEDVENAKEPDETVGVELCTEQGIPRPYRRNIISGLCKLYFCKLVLNTRRSIKYGEKGYFIIGKPSNVIVVKHMAKYIIDLCDNLAKKEGGSDRHFRTSFKNGFGGRVFERCLDEIERAKKGEVKDDAGKALILHPLYSKSDKEISTWIKNEWGGLGGTFGGRSRSRNAKGYNAGSAAGSKVSLRSNALSRSGSATKQIGG